MNNISNLFNSWNDSDCYFQARYIKQNGYHHDSFQFLGLIMDFIVKQDKLNKIKNISIPFNSSNDNKFYC